MANKPEDKDAIRKIWLAGIGAYGRAFTEAKGAVESLTGKSSEVFEELVQKGEMLEAVGKYKASELVGKGKAAVPDFDIDDRIAKMRARLSGAADKSDEGLAARVDGIEAKLDAILERLDIGNPGSPKSKTPVKKKAATANTSAKKIAKPPSKKKMTTQRTPKVKTAKKPSAPKKSSTKTTKKKSS